jgi:hypothetical protein
MIPLSGDRPEFSPFKPPESNKIDEGSINSTDSTSRADSTTGKPPIVPRKDAWLWFPAPSVSEVVMDVIPMPADTGDMSTLGDESAGLGDVAEEFLSGEDTKEDSFATVSVEATSVGKVDGMDLEGRIINEVRDEEVMGALPPLGAVPPKPKCLTQQGHTTRKGNNKGLKEEEESVVPSELKLLEQELKAAAEKERVHHNTNFSWLKKHQMPKEYCVNDTAYELMVVRYRYFDHICNIRPLAHSKLCYQYVADII